MDHINEIKKLKDKIIIGKESVKKSLENGKLKIVYMAKNCPPTTVDEMNHFTKLSKTELITLEVANDELGIICKKMFSISVIGVDK